MEAVGGPAGQHKAVGLDLAKSCNLVTVLKNEKIAIIVLKRADTNEADHSVGSKGILSKQANLS